VTYYMDSGTYYLRTPSGYQVVLPPRHCGGPIEVEKGQ
jgi:hypothetical protein